MNTLSRIEAVFPSTGTIQIEWEETNCLLCDSPNWSPLLEACDLAPGGSGLRFAVSQCRDCGLTFTNPRPSCRSIGNFYPPDYQPHRPSAADRRARWRKRYPGLPRWLVRKHQPVHLQGEGRLLDFGCGSGLFLEQMRSAGWHVTGVDVSTTTVRRLRDDLAIEAYTGSLPHPELAGRRFDVITMWHSLEHVHQPRKVLEAAFALLVPGGKLIVAVPNMDSLPVRWFGPCWYGFDVPRHLTHFTSDTLPRMLQRSGFRPDPIRMVRHSSWLRMSARLALRNGQPSWWSRLLLCKPISRLASWYTYWRGQADCIMATAVKR
jgi:SAM-dependent methyltransferase